MAGREVKPDVISHEMLRHIAAEFVTRIESHPDIKEAIRRRPSRFRFVGQTPTTEDVTHVIMSVTFGPIYPTRLKNKEIIYILDSACSVVQYHIYFRTYDVTTIVKSDSTMAISTDRPGISRTYEYSNPHAFDDIMDKLVELVREANQEPDHYPPPITDKPQRDETLHVMHQKLGVMVVKGK